MGSVWRGDAARLGAVAVLIGVLVVASSPAVLAQATPEAEPTQEVSNPPAEPTETVPTLVPTEDVPTPTPEPTGEVPTLVPTEAVPTATAEPTEDVPDPTAAPAGRASMGIMAEPFEVVMDGPATVALDGDVTYTIEVTNISGRTIESVQLHIPILATQEWSIVADRTTFDCNADGSSCNSSNMASGRTLTATVTAPVPGAVDCGNWWSLSAGTSGWFTVDPPEPLPPVNSEFVTTEVVCDEPAAPFEVTLEGPATIRPGDDLTYTMTFTNTSGETFERVDASNRSLPSGLVWEIVPESAAFSSCFVRERDLGCQLQSVEASDSLIVTVTAQVPEDTSCGTTYTMSWGANATYSVGPPHVSTGRIDATPVTTEVVCDASGPTEPLVKTGPASVAPGEPLSYTITITDDEVEELSIRDVIPDLGTTWEITRDDLETCEFDEPDGVLQLVCPATLMDAEVPRTVTIQTVMPDVPDTAVCADGLTNVATSIIRYQNGDQVLFKSKTVTTAVSCETLIDLAKAGSYDAPTADDPLGRIDWTLTVTNTGDVDLTDATVTDESVADLDCDPATAGNQATIASLPPGAAHAVTCTATSLVTVADGGTTVSNEASVSAASPLGDDPVTDTASAGVDVPALTGGIAVTKTVTNQPAGGFDLGDTITYQIAVTNTGDVSLFNVTVSDDRVTDLDCGTGSTGGSVTLDLLDPGDTNAVTCTASATWPVPSAGPPDTVLANTVTVSAPFDGSPLTDSATAEATLAAIGSDLQLAVDPATVTAPGPVTLTWTLTNTGGVTLHGLGLDASLPLDCDPAMDGDQAMPAVLVPGVAVTCTATLEATQGDIDAGDPLVVTRTLTVFGEADTATVQVPIEQRPAVTLAKSVDPVAIDAIGDVTWAFTITNTGNVTLTGLVLDDPLVAPATLDCDPDTAGTQPLPDRLAPGTAITCTAVMEIDQEQVDDRQPLTNTAQVASDQATSNSASATLTITPRDGLALVLTADPATLDAPADITWTYALANNGTSTLTGLAIDDPALDPAALDCDPADGLQPLPDRLDPGSELICTAIETVGQEQIDAGDPITREALATSAETDSNLARATVSIVQAPGIGLTKTVTSATAGLVTGDVVTYELALANTGNVTVANPEIVDAGTDTLECGAIPETLAPKATVTCTATYTITDADMLRGSYTNTASATATVRTGVNREVQSLRQAAPLVVEATGSATVTTAPVQVGLTIIKSVDPAGTVPEGTVLTYTFVVTNSGNVSLNHVKVLDVLPGLAWDDASSDGTVGALAGGESVTLTATYKVTSVDVAHGAVVNVAVAAGQHPACRAKHTVLTFVACAVPSAPSSVMVKTLAPEPTATLPVEPTATLPVEPTATLPAEPTATLPAEPTATFPAEPTATLPVEPTATLPAEPTATLPAEPTMTQPAAAKPTAMPSDPTPDVVTRLPETGSGPPGGGGFGMVAFFAMVALATLGLTIRSFASRRPPS